MDVCRLVDHPTPAEKYPRGEFFTFECGVRPHRRPATPTCGTATLRHRYRAWQVPDLDAAYSSSALPAEPRQPAAAGVCESSTGNPHQLQPAPRSRPPLHNRDIATSTPFNAC